MSTEEAEFILNEAVIKEPSICSYVYISAEEINQAIQTILEERVREQKKIKELEETLVIERNRLENIIKEMKIKNDQVSLFTNKYIDQLKKVTKPLFLLEN